MRFSIGVLLILALGAGMYFYRTKSESASAVFDGVSLRIEYATTPEARERGLSGRANIPSDYGMLFVFPKDDRYGFWMKDVLVPIDIFWLDSDGHVVSIISDIATSTYPDVFYPTEPARYVLETAAGFAKEHGIANGAPFLLKKFPTVSQ
ncbi:DUF192 domain-containing protein [Candidatus Kaiserbacteria bacterium]|nr:DUF192 domain-containing protein [Candidatus Kaiserbacteria bacterium]